MGLRIQTARGLYLIAACIAVSALGATDALAQDAAARGPDIREEVLPSEWAGSGRLARTAPRGPVWDITLEAGLSIFEDPQGILGEPLPGGVTPFDFGANSYDAAFGLRLTVGYSTGRRSRWEGRGSWLGSWDASSRQTGQFGFRAAPGAALILSPVATTTLANETDVWSGEINWWNTCSCDPCSQLDWGVGARVIGIDDEASATNWAGLAPGSTLSAEADNRFIGAQLMGAYRGRPSRQFSWSVSAKALLGWMNRDMTESDTSIVTGGPTTNGAREETGFSWGFELEVSAIWRVMSRIGITASYTLLYLDEVSRVENVLDFAQAASGSLQMKDATDSALIHAFFVGVRIDI